MSYADKIFVDMCRNILDNGTDLSGTTDLLHTLLRSLVQLTDMI